MGVFDLAKKLNRAYKDDKLAIRADVTPTYERMQTGAFGLDYPLYGGLPLGRIHTFAGLQHSGKTSAACMAVSAYQRQFPDRPCIYVDMEHSLDLKFQSRMTGMQLNKMIYFSPTSLTGEQVLDEILNFQKEDDIGLIVIDSIPAILPAESLEKDMTKDPGMRGTIAKALHRFLIAMGSLVSEKNNMLILINQVRIAGKTFTGANIYSEPGGDAPNYYSSVKVRFGTRTFIKGDKVDSTDGEGAEGFRLKFSITKNKCGPIARGGGFLSFNYDTGFRWLEDMLEIAYKFDFIQRINQQTYQLVDLETGEIYKDESGKDLIGRRKDLEDYILTNIPFQTKYIAMLNKAISGSDRCYGNILDERDRAEINAQEESIESKEAKTTYKEVNEELSEGDKEDSNSNLEVN